MNTKPVALYKQGNDGSTRVWAIHAEDGDIVIEHGVLFGSMQEKRETVAEGKGGRTKNQQIMMMMASRINKKKDAGYSANFEDSKKKATNSLNLPKPMLAATYKHGMVKGNVYVQYKFDGNRCLITKQDGEVFAYTRNGKRIDSIDHILEAAKDIPEGAILDGELYCHGVALQTLRSWISRKQAESNGLIYQCYDIINNNPYSMRLQELKKLELGDCITLTNSELINALTLRLEVYNKLKNAIANGYEGLILRTDDKGYEDGKRSKSLIKVKQWMDSEFQVIRIERSKDGWAILVMESESGIEFRASAPGSVAEKIECYQNRGQYIDKDVTLQYANLTKTGVPFHPVAVAWRTKDD